MRNMQAMQTASLRLAQAEAVDVPLGLPAALRVDCRPLP